MLPCRVFFFVFCFNQMDKLVLLTFRIVLRTNVKKNGDKIVSSDLDWNKSWYMFTTFPILILNIVNDKMARQQCERTSLEWATARPVLNMRVHCILRRIVMPQKFSLLKITFLHGLVRLCTSPCWYIAATQWHASLLSMLVHVLGHRGLSHPSHATSFGIRNCCVVELVCTVLCAV